MKFGKSAAEAFELPLLPPYLGITAKEDVRKGVNFAVSGATALDPKFFYAQNIGSLLWTNDSLSVQLSWFKKVKFTLCSTKHDCDNYFKKSLFVIGEIGGNDYNYPFAAGASIQQVRSLVPLVILAICNATSTLIEEGAVNLLVPGNIPRGCSPAFLATAASPNRSDYDPLTGCLKSYNAFSEYHDQQLKKSLQTLQWKYPHARIMFGDYYGASMRFYRAPSLFAEALHLPLLSPYLKVADGQINIPGVNFAVAGASALDTNFFKGLPVTTNISLNVQLSWFKKWKSSFCANRQDCERYLNKSLFVVREIGGNDYNNGLFVGQGIENGKALVRTVVEDNTNATINLIEEGAVDLMVSGNLPIGCMLMFLTMFGSSNQSNYGKSTGCLKTFNALARYHNKKLRQSLEELRSKYPNSKIMYADYYRAAMKLYKDPKQHGFTGGALSACRGVGGPYNFNNSAKCGDTGSSVCVNSSTFISWDGIHFTESAYRNIADRIIRGPLSITE
ncbi:hypothetical protein CDL15_Pgr016748 [Punica granatum]|uniref:GDSL esterase/lipase At5g45910-like n=1 Tax=Punica granatum TaxID=22663 RepID=A0A218WYR2_PUNGR|nr:hypothetical protein CDL15_Pgr016748 [Punica granatum]